MSLFYKVPNDGNNLYPDLKNDGSNLYPDLKNPKQQAPRSNAQEIFHNPKNQGDLHASVFISKQKQPEKEPGCCEKMCKCFTLAYYKDYFKVTNNDVKKRIVCNLKFWNGGFFVPAEQEYDLYGPFWLYTTLIFIVSAIQNILIYQNSGKDTFNYNFQGLGSAFQIFYLLGFGLSVVIGFLLNWSGINCRVIQIICLYGYSMAIYIVCVILCGINISMLTWLFLLYACGTKISYVLKNIFEGMEVPTTKKVFVTVLVIIEAVIQLLIIKFVFIKTGDTTASAFSHMEFMQLRFYHQ